MIERPVTPSSNEIIIQSWAETPTSRHYTMKNTSTAWKTPERAEGKVLNE